MSIKDISLNGSERIILKCWMFITERFDKQLYAYEVKIVLFSKNH